MTREYTKTRQVYAWVGFTTLLILAIAGLVYSVRYCTKLDQADKVQLEDLINNNLA